MRRIGQISSGNKSSKNTFLISILFCAVFLTTVFISKTGMLGGIFALGVIAALFFTVIAFMNPVFGFYLTIFVGFFFSDLKRLLHLSIPLGTYIDMLMFITFLGVVFSRLLKKQPLLVNCNHPIVYVYLVMVIYSLIELFNPDRGLLSDTLLILRRFFAFIFFFYSAIQLFDTINAIHKFFRIFLFLSILTGLYGCYQQWFGYPAYELISITSNPITEMVLSLHNGDYRKFSFLPDPVAFGVLMSATALICIVFLLKLKNTPSRRILLFLSIIFMIIGMAASGTRTATFALVTGAAFYILMTLTDIRTLLFACISVVAFIFIVFGPIHGNASINRIRSTFEFSKDNSFNLRDENRHKIQPYIYSHPIGGGLGTSGGAQPDLDLKGTPIHPLAGFQTDSGFLRMALEYGWIGLIIQCILLFTILQQGIRSYYRSSDAYHKIIFLACTVSLFCFIVANYAQETIGNIPGGFLFYSLVAIIIRLKQIGTSNNSIKTI